MRAFRVLNCFVALGAPNCQGASRVLFTIFGRAGFSGISMPVIVAPRGGAGGVESRDWSEKGIRGAIAAVRGKVNVSDV